MADFVYSHQARRDLFEIWEFIAKDNLDAADRVADEIERAAGLLSQNPELGRRRPDLTTKPVRFWPVYSYVIVYNPSAHPLEIIRILSGYRDLAVLLNS